MVSPSPTCSCRHLGRSRAGRHRVVGTPDILSLLSSSLYPTPGSPFLSPTRSPIRDGSPALVLSLSLISLASAEWEKSQPPPKLRLRPGHARHPPPLPPSLSPPSLPSIYSSHSLSPSLLPHSGRGCRCRAPLPPRPGRGHRPPPLPPPLPFISSPSLSALPHSPAARPPPCPCPSLVPLPGTRPSGKGPQPSPSDGHAAALHRPFVIIVIIFSFLLSRYPPLSLSLSPSSCHFTTLYTPTFLYSLKDFFL